MFYRQIIDRLFAALDHIEYGAINMTMPDGKTRSFKGSKPGAQAEITIHDWRIVGAVVISGSVGLAETYRNGLWDSPDIVQLFLFGLENQQALDSYIYGNAFGRLAARILHMFNRNTVRGSKKNIHAHYDLGNEFYQLWLDRSMTYSSALFGNELDSNEADNLHKAQINKYDRMINRMRPSGKMLEIGCGWGGFVERALQKGDYGLKGLTISRAQYEYAANRVGNDATIALEDYRHQTGLYDQIVSIEMFEAVGEKFWPVYFSQLKSLLAKKGKAMLQSITIADDRFANYRRSGDAIRTFIFPGGMLPSPTRFREEIAKAGLRLTDEFAFGKDYALTLLQWLRNFDGKLKEIKNMGFDDKFIRIWRFYLTFCAAAFQHGRTDVIQWEVEHAK